MAQKSRSRRPSAAWKDCPGEHGAYVESCSSCAPFWMRIAVCPSKTCGARLSLNRKHTIGTCEKHGRFNVDNRIP